MEDLIQFSPPLESSIIKMQQQDDQLNNLRITDDQLLAEARSFDPPVVNLITFYVTVRSKQCEFIMQASQLVCKLKNLTF